MAEDLFETLLRAGLDIDVVVPPGSGSGDFPDDARIRVHRTGRQLVPQRGVIGRVLGLIETTMRFIGRSLLASRDARPAVVYGLSAVTIPAATVVSIARRAPSIGFLFGTFLYPALGQRRRLLAQFVEVIAFKMPVDRLVILNDGTRGDDVARRLGVPPHRLRFWMHGVDVDECVRARNAAPIRDQLDLPTDSALVVSTSRLTSWKRVDDVVRAFARVLPTHPEAILVISGVGPDEDSLKELAARTLPDRNVMFVGALSRDTNLRLIAQSDVFCSFYDYSNVGYALLEALAAGAPVVVTNTGATSTVVTDGLNGLVVEPRDPVAAARTIDRLLTDARERERLGRNARQRARADFLTPQDRARLELELLGELGIEVETLR